MAEESKQAFDPDATVAQPLKLADPEATVTQPVVDPEATVTQPIQAIQALDPEATITRPAMKLGGDPDATDTHAAFDPDATDRRPAFDPEATFSIPSPGKLRSNPFAPKSAPETLQVNLSSLGGLNPLVAMANPILAAVPQIRRALKHPDPAALLAGLRDQLESLEMSAISAEIPDDTVSAAVYALCALLDESAAATPWGRDWIENGLLQNLRGESGGAEGFFTQLEQLSAAPEQNADLLEFLYVCLALGFEGRYRDAEGGRQALAELRDRLYALITRRRPRPDALSEQWRTPAAQAAADAALQTAARANAARAAAEAAARAAESSPRKPEPASRYALSRWPRRAIWSAVAGIVGAAVVFYMLALRLLDEETSAAMTPKAGLRSKAASAAKAPAPVPAPNLSASAVNTLSQALGGLPVTVTEKAGEVVFTLLDGRQFASGSAQPAPGPRALFEKIAEVLDKLPGTILVAGHADASPAGTRYASNDELSISRARTVAQLMAKKLADPKRVSAEGRADAEPAAPHDSEAGRAMNRRVTVHFKPTP